MSIHSVGCLILCFGLCIGLSGCDTSSNIDDPDIDYFIKYYGGGGNQFGVDMLALQDGSFLLLGNYAESEFNSDVYLVRVSTEGDVLSEARIGDPDDIDDLWTARDLEPTSDGNFIVLADYKKNSADNQDSSDVKLIKVTYDGVILDSMSYGTIANDFARSVTALSDGGFIVSGQTELTATFNLTNETDPDHGDTFIFRVGPDLVPLPASGLISWSPVVHGYGSNLDVAVRAHETSTGFYVFGYTNSTLAGDLNPDQKLGLFYMERGPTGSLIKVWYPGNIVSSNDTEIHAIQPVDPVLGGGYLIIGTSVSSLGISEMFVARMRPSLSFANPLSNDASFYNTISLGRSIRGVSTATSLVGERGFLLLGNEVRSAGLNMWLTKIDQSGQVLWSTTFGSEAEDDMAAAVTELPDGKVVILGTMGLADSQFKMALIKLNRKGQLLK